MLKEIKVKLEYKEYQETLVRECQVGVIQIRY
jgi:hypothetical protein|uniref:Uncharacterized protein n=1 Tax=virus sp. ctrcb4 TaxID=2825824 RepID=A0A8S5RQ29_9VIRU|nr:MAG TPA: hypothetical protein [virus sp. ctrcb4]